MERDLKTKSYLHYTIKSSYITEVHVALSLLDGSVPCSGTAPNLTLDLNAERRTHLFWDAREVAQEG